MEFCLHVTAPNPGTSEMIKPITQVKDENSSRRAGSSNPRPLTIPVSRSKATNAPAHTIHAQPPSLPVADIFSFGWYISRQ